MRRTTDFAEPLFANCAGVGIHQELYLLAQEALRRKRGGSDLWKCSVCGHIYPACAGKVATATNNLAMLYPEIAAMWDYEKNGDAEA